MQGNSWVPLLAFALRSGGWGRAYYMQCCQKEQSSCSWGHSHRGEYMDLMVLNIYTGRLQTAQGAEKCIWICLHFCPICLFILQQNKVEDQMTYSYVDLMHIPNLRNLTMFFFGKSLFIYLFICFFNMFIFVLYALVLQLNCKTSAVKL